ncbi:MAG: 30S ribosomal protein S3ae [Candidatus Nitrosocaldaceae archaeon]
MVKRVGKVKDKWKEKQWVIVKAPASFGYHDIAYVPITDTENAIGRIVECTLFDIWKSDPLQHTIKLYFKIEKIEDEYAYAQFKGHEYAREYIRSLVRKGTSLVTYINDFTTKDNYKFRMSVMAFTQRKINSSKKWLIRKTIHNILQKEIPNLTLDQFVQSVVGPKINAELLKEAKNIVGVRYIAVVKTKLLAIPEQLAYAR